MRCTRRAAAAATAADYKMEGRGEALHIACAVIAAIVRFSMKVKQRDSDRFNILRIMILDELVCFTCEANNVLHFNGLLSACRGLLLLYPQF